MQYVTKLKPDLTKDCIITHNVQIHNGVLTFKDNNDIITCTKDGWFINNYYQGEGAGYQFYIDKSEVINPEMLLKVFEEVNNG